MLLATVQFILCTLMCLQIFETLNFDGFFLVSEGVFISKFKTLTIFLGSGLALVLMSV